MERIAHWEHIYETKTQQDVSWVQPIPKALTWFLENHPLSKETNIIDIGCGDSFGPDTFLKAGFTNISVLDISKAALNRAQKRLGDQSEKVKWIQSDITQFKPDTTFDFWYDRAVFHFLTDPKDIQTYVDLVGQSTKKGSYFLLGTFSKNGPTKCSGLPISQYSDEDMEDLFHPNFTKIHCFTEEHITPKGKVQDFQFCLFERK